MRHILLATLILAVGCTADEAANSQTDGGPPDDGVAVADTGANDDSGGSTEDTGGNNTVSDMATDSGDNPEDMNGVDAGEDMTADLGADMSSSACAAGYTAQDEVPGAVVACTGTPVNQCDAAEACGVGWHVCTASEYRAQFEAVEPVAAATGTYWLAGCVRDGADSTAPSDLVCSDCTGTMTGPDAEVSFSCLNSITLETDQLFVGVRAGTACTFVGTDAAGNDAFWNAQPADVLQDGAICCID